MAPAALHEALARAAADEAGVEPLPVRYHPTTAQTFLVRLGGRA